MKYSAYKVGQRVRVAVVGPNGVAVTEGLGTILNKHPRIEGGSMTVLLDGETEGQMVNGRFVSPIEVDPLDQIHPMLAKDATADVDRYIESDEWWFEKKLDGERQILTYNGPAGRFRATTRVRSKTNARLTENTETLSYMAALPVPGGVTVFDTELLHVGGFRRLRSIMGSLPERARELMAEHGEVTAYVFDVLWFGGHDLRALPFHQRRRILDSWHEEVLALDDPWVDRVCPTLMYRTPTQKSALWRLVQESNGEIEGVMAKSIYGAYTDSTRPEQRSKSLLKIKPFTADEFVILGFEAGAGQYNRDKLGTMRLGQFFDEGTLPSKATTFTMPTGQVLLDCGTCGIGTQEDEARFRADPDRWIGATVEVKFQARWPETGLLRHPSFMRLRTDKDPRECRYPPAEVGVGQ